MALVTSYRYGKASLLNEKRDSLEVRAGSLLAVDVDSFLALSDELKILSPNKNDREQKKTILAGENGCPVPGGFFEGTRYQAG